MESKYNIFSEKNIDWVFPNYFSKKNLLKSIDDLFSKNVNKFPENGEYFVTLDVATMRFSATATKDINKMTRLFLTNIPAQESDTKFDLIFPIQALIKTGIDIRDKYCVYGHEVWIDGKYRQYHGITKQKWYARFSQHLSNARSGSPYVFHSALRSSNIEKIVHFICGMAMTYEEAMNMEEKLVENSLYPLGLNMIPGGFAGLRYLHTLGIEARNIKQRDIALLELSKRENINGSPNPLCAARWKSDQDFINSVICGHGNRFSVDDVMTVRRYVDFEYDVEKIQSIFPDKSKGQIIGVMSGKRYSKVK